MDSLINGGGVPISAIQAAPKVPFATSTGIRAPLTIDDNDFEYSASSGGRKDSFFSSFSSDDGELEFGGFETASGSDGPFPADPDDKMLVETNVTKEYVVSRPIVISQFAEESSDRNSEPDLVGGEGVFSRSIGGNHSYEHFDESGNIRKLRISRDSLHYSNEEPVEDNDSSEEYSECTSFKADTEEEEDALGPVSYEVDSELTTVDNANDLMTNQSIPIAQVCWSSDGDFLGDEVSSDGSFSGVTEWFKDAPKIGVLNVEEESENLAEEDSGVIVNSTTGNAVGDYLKENGIENNFSENTENVNEGFQELEKNSFNAIENTGSEQMVQKSDEEVQSHATNVPTNIEFYKTGVMEEEEEGQSLENANLGEALIAERSDAFGNNINASDIVQSLGETPITVTFENNRYDVETIQSLVMEDENYSTSEVSQNSLMDLLSSIIGKKDSVLLENKEDALKYDETPTQESLDRADDVLLLPDQNLSISLCYEIDLLNNVGVKIMSESKEEEQEAREEDPLGEAIPSSLDVVPGPTMSESKEKLEARENSLEEEIPATSDAVPGPTMSESKEEQEAHRDSLGEEIPTTSDSVPGPTMSDSKEEAHEDLLGESGDMSNMEVNKKLVKLQLLGIKFFRLALRLNQSFHDNTVAAKVLNKILVPAQSFKFEFAKQTAMLLEAEGVNLNHLDFSLNILLIGKSGVGKSATINSLFGECIAITSPFQPSTTSVKIIKGTINGVKVQVLDTPGLRSYPYEQSFNRKALLSIKKYMKKFPPDVVLYVDRLDMKYEDLNDIPLLRSVTRYLGSSIWFKTIVILTHAGLTPPGSDLSYRFFVTRQSQAVQRLITHGSGCGHAIKPAQIYVSLVENNQAVGENVNGSSWREKLVFLCYSFKILSEMDYVIKPKVIFFDYRKFFGFNNRSLLQSPNFYTTLDDENFGSDAELEYSPEMLNVVKKQRINIAKADDVCMEENLDQEEAGNYGENIAYKQSLFESRILNRMSPLLNFQAWDYYDCGYNNLTITGRFPCSFCVQVSVGGSSIRVGVCRKKIRQVSIIIKSSDDISLALLGLFPFAKMALRKFIAHSGER